VAGSAALCFLLYSLLVWGISRLNYPGTAVLVQRLFACLFACLIVEYMGHAVPSALISAIGNHRKLLSVCILAMVTAQQLTSS